MMTEVSVRRLWPGLYPQGETFELPADQADAAIAAGLVIPVLPDGGPVTAGPLGDVIRARFEADGELAGLLATAAKYAGRTRNAGLLRCLASLLPRRLRPADFTPGRFRAEHGERPLDGWYSRPPQWNGGTRDPRALCLAQHLDRRRDELLVDVFEPIQDGQSVARGRPAGSPVVPIDIPADVFGVASTRLDLLRNQLAFGDIPAFVDITVQPPPARTASRSALDRFVAGFDAAMLASGRRYVVSELVAAARQQLGPAVSAREVDGALKRGSVAAWAGSGRRPGYVAPSAAELTCAARQAAESRA
jgi:hypothetical protein